MKKKKLPNQKQKIEILTTMNELMEEGFHFFDILPFMTILYPDFESSFLEIEIGLKNGERLSQALGQLGLSSTEQYRLQVMERSGDFSEHLKQHVKHLQQSYIQEQKIKKTMSYPLFLSLLVLGMMIGLKIFMLPQLKLLTNGKETIEEQLLFKGLEIFPYVTIILVITILGLILVSKQWEKKDPIKRLYFLTHLPHLGLFYREYYTYFFSLEFSHFFQNGYSFQQIMEEWKAEKEAPLFQSFGNLFEKFYKEGQPLEQSIRKIDVFTPEFPVIVLQGEQISQLGIKMEIYGEKCFVRWRRRIEQEAKLIQNLMFVLVALLVVVTYLTLMIPMFSMASQLSF